eukprot:ctg_387.g184
MMPPSRIAAIDRDFEQAVTHMQQAILLGRTLRERHGIALKQPLRRARIVHCDEQAVQRVRALEHYVRLELNVHDVEYSTDEARYLSYRAVPDGKVLGPRLGAAFPAVARQVRGWSSAQVMALLRHVHPARYRPRTPADARGCGGGLGERRNAGAGLVAGRDTGAGGVGARSGQSGAAAAQEDRSGAQRCGGGVRGRQWGGRGARVAGAC